MKAQLAVCAVAAAVLIPTSANASSPGLRLLYQARAQESGRVAVDRSGHHNNGVLKGGVSRRYGAYKFHPLSKDHRYDRIVAPDAPSLSPGLSPFSYSARVKISPHAEWENTEMAIMRHGDNDNGTGGNYKMEVKKVTSGAVVAECVMHDATAHAGYVRGRPGLATVADGRYHTITCARTDDDTVTLTIDGQAVTGQTSGRLADLSGQARLLIGCQIQSTRAKREQFVGKLDNITVRVG